MDTREALALKHNFIRESVFHLKSYLLIFKRSISNLSDKTKKYTSGTKLTNAPILSISESALWNKDDNKDNWILTAGKIENLRIASRNLHGIEVPAGKTFSFWKQVGKLTCKKGYVPGRELREGCIIPSIGGGICQLSNALYDAACKAGFEIQERHKHTKVIKGSLAEQNRDATVKWNYIDLRFRAPIDFRIEIELTTNKCIVRLKGIYEAKNVPLESKEIVTPWPLNDCYSCYNTACYICNAKEKIQDKNITTYILDEHWKEYENYVNNHAGKEDIILIPFRSSQPTWYRNEQNAWNITNGIIRTFSYAAFQRVISFHCHKKKRMFFFAD
ncbi:MAG: VanW family protein [Tannerellaceae bacterium]|nr:VanW family protein [Tannerellaceae bacterium]